MKHNATNTILMMITIALFCIWFEMRNLDKKPQEVTIKMDWGIALEDTQFPPLPVRKVR